VRGIKLADGDSVVGLGLLHHVDASSAEARAYLKQASAARRAAGEEADTAPEDVAEDEEGTEEAALSPDRYAELGAKEQFVFALSENGFGKRTSSYEYRVTGRGGSGIVAMGMGRKNRAISSAFPVDDGDDLMLISDKGQIIRVAVKDISYQGRAAQGVTVFRLDPDERVVSVERIAESSAEAGDGDEGGEAGDDAGASGESGQE
jgi:DNA gyrase subunit A